LYKNKLQLAMEQWVKKVEGIIFCVIMVVMLGGFSACSEEEIPDMITEQEIEFLTEAGKRLEEIIRMGNLAIHRSEHPAVQSFASSKVSALRSCRLDLRGLAYLYEIPYPSEPRPLVQETYQDLAGMYGYKFDSTYVHHQVLAKQEAKELFHQYVNNGSHEKIRNFALLQLSEFTSKLEGAQVLQENLYQW